MEKSVAVFVNRKLRHAAGLLDRSVAIAQESASDEGLREFRYQIGDVMGEMYDLVLRDIWKRFPELKPEGMRDDS